MYKSKIELQKPNKPRQPNLLKCNVISRFFSPYKPFKIKKYNWWFNVYQGYFNVKNIFIIHWLWICDSLHPSIRYGFTLFGFVLPLIERHRSLLGINFYTWDEKPAGYLSINFLYLPSLDFRIGNGKTWLWIRNGNWYGYKIHKQNKKITF